MSPKMPSDFLPFPSANSLVLLSQVRQRLTQRDLAARLDVSPKTISRWERRQTDCPAYVQAALRDILRSGARSEPGTAEFTFIDLFAGIGGMRLGFEKAGGCCVFTSEWNAYANRTYAENFDSGHPMVGFITKFDEEKVPDHDVLLAGFPCQCVRDAKSIPQAQNTISSPMIRMFPCVT